MLMRVHRAWIGCLLFAVALAAAQDEPKITLNADDLPAQKVLAEVARQSGRKLEVKGKFPNKRLDLVLRAAPLEAAVQQIAAQLEMDYEVTAEAIRFLPREEGAVAPSSATIAGVPAAVAEELDRRLDAVRPDPAAGAPLHELGAWLRDLRPDWRETVRGVLPQRWLGTDAAPARALAGAGVMLRLGEIEAARQLVPVARKDEELRFDAHCLMAAIELERGNPSRAAAEAGRAIELRPDDPRPVALLAAAKVYLRFPEEALAEAMIAEARWPKSPEVLAALGNILRGSEAAAGEADRYLQRALNGRAGLADALFGLAALGSRDRADDRERWQAFLRAEPFSVRADHVRLGLVAIQSMPLAERGGPVWDVSLDGERVLYTMKFRKQLEITDAQGFGLANQVTDQDTDKVHASLSPDEQTLAWIVEQADGDRLYTQNINASGHQQEVAKAPKGSNLLRSAWTPDGKYLLFTERELGATEWKVKLRCLDVAAGSEIEPPPPLDLDGLGDVAWSSAGMYVGTVSRGGEQIVVGIPPDGEPYLLRPPARLRRYAAPSLDTAATRLVYQGGSLNAARPDGATRDGVPVLTGSSSNYPGIWVPGEDRMIVTLDDNWPTALELGGLKPRHELLCQPSNLFLKGAEPPTFRYRLRNLGDRTIRAALQATVVDDQGAAGWRKDATVTLRPGQDDLVELRPGPGPAGVHWLRVDLVVDDVADPARWYRYEITG